MILTQQGKYAPLSRPARVFSLRQVHGCNSHLLQGRCQWGSTEREAPKSFSPAQLTGLPQGRSGRSRRTWHWPRTQSATSVEGHNKGKQGGHMELSAALPISATPWHERAPHQAGEPQSLKKSESTFRAWPSAADAALGGQQGREGLLTARQAVWTTAQGAGGRPTTAANLSARLHFLTHRGGAARASNRVQPRDCSALANPTGIQALTIHHMATAAHPGLPGGVH